MSRLRAETRSLSARLKSDNLSDEERAKIEQRLANLRRMAGKLIWKTRREKMLHQEETHPGFSFPHEDEGFLDRVWRGLEGSSGTNWYKISQEEGEQPTAVRFDCPVTGYYIMAFKWKGHNEFFLFNVFDADGEYVDESWKWEDAVAAGKEVNRRFRPSRSGRKVD